MRPAVALALFAAITASSQLALAQTPAPMAVVVPKVAAPVQPARPANVVRAAPAPSNRVEVRTPAPSAPSVPPGATVVMLNGQRYLLVNLADVSTGALPSARVAPSAGAYGALPAYGAAAYAPSLYGAAAGMSPSALSTPPPVMIYDGPSPTIGGAGGGGFTLPVPGAHANETMTNPGPSVP
jgi:hypothetical protein